MAGINFNFEDFKQIIRLNIGIANRLDENRAESFTILYCDLSSQKDDKIAEALEKLLRTSDTININKSDYYFVLPNTDKYGAEIVKKIFDDFFDDFIKSFHISYPSDGESTDELIMVLQSRVKHFCKKDLSYLDRLK